MLAAAADDRVKAVFCLGECRHPSMQLDIQQEQMILGSSST